MKMVKTVAEKNLNNMPKQDIKKAIPIVLVLKQRTKQNPGWVLKP